MNEQKATALRKKIRKELRKQGLTELGIAQRAQEHALAAVQDVIRDKPRFVPTWAWELLLDFIIPDIRPALEAGARANLEVRNDLAA